MRENYTTNNIKEATAVTHAGVFHADEVFATVILNRALGGIKVIRTNNVPEDLPKDVIIYDIGEGKYDHHGLAQKDHSNGVPYAACGMIWKDFGWKIKEIMDCKNSTLAYHMIDEELIQGIDAADNGKMPQAKYPVQELGIYKIISQFNPNWDEDISTEECFEKACDFADTIFENVLANAVARANAYEEVDEAISKSNNGIMVFENGYVPFEDLTIISANPKAPGVCFAVYPSLRQDWACKAVPDKKGGKGQRKSLPEEWRGLSGEELQRLTGVKTAVFCHPKRFMCTAQTREDAIKLAKLAMAK